MFAAIISYTIFWIASCILIYLQYQYANRRHDGFWWILDKSCQRSKMPLFLMIVISLLFVIFNYVATETSIGFGHDRTNYLASFNGSRSASNLILRLLIVLSHRAGLNFNTFLYLITFLFSMLTLYAYRISTESTPYGMFLLFLTPYYISSLTALKQAFAAAAASIFFVVLIENNTRKSKIIALLLMLFCILSHPSGYILIPLYLLLRKKPSKLLIVGFFVAFLIIAVLFENLIPVFMRISALGPADIFDKMEHYFGEERDFENSFGSYILKGIPYYYIVLMGVLNRRELVRKIENYDKYLLVASTGAFLFLMSWHSYWFTRFIYLFNFIMIIFWCKIVKQIKDRSNRLCYNMILQLAFGLFTYRWLYLIYAISGGF